MASAVEQLLNGNTSGQPVSWGDYYYAYVDDRNGKIKPDNWMRTNPDGLLSKGNDFLTGYRSSALAEYEKYLADYEAKRNREYVDEANKKTWEREDSQIQRAMADYKAAGLNPYVLVNSGSVGSSAVSSQAQAASYKRSFRKESDKSLMSSALKILAILMLKKLF